MSIRLLMTGDLHLGRASSHTGSSRADQHQCAQVWQRIVDRAIHEQVLAVCLSGDIIDGSNKFWESIGHLERGCRRLAEAGIQCIAVAGNHDFDVLDHVANQLADDQYFHILGRGGQWERLTLSQDDEDDDEDIVHIDGWSFPSLHIDSSPLDSYTLSTDGNNIPILGMVHGDLDVTHSRYAPLSLSELFRLPPTAWLLGHIHAPRLEPESQSWVLYPGSPQALDPGELHTHGPWICEISNGHIHEPQQIALSSTQYVRCEIDLSDSNSIQDIENCILDAVSTKVECICDRTVNTALSLISMRLRLVGHCPLSHELENITRAMRDQLDRSLPSGNGSVIIDRIDIHCLPAITLNDYQQSKNVLGIIVRLLDDIDNDTPSPETQDLIRQSMLTLNNAQNNKKRHHQIAREAQIVTTADAKALLKQQSAQLLSELVSQSQDSSQSVNHD